MPKRDIANEQTDEALADLEKRISRIYADARDDMSAKVDEYFSYYRKREEHQRELLKKGEITEEQFKQWRLNQMGRGERFEAMRDKLADRMTRANEVAAAYINDSTPGIYSINRNYAAYTIESVAGDVGFDMWDEQTVKRLIREQPDLMPYYPPERAVKRGIDLKWGKKQITAQVTSGILQGESIKSLADRLNNNIPDMNRTSAIRAARTAVTGAQNAGRIESYAAAQKMGIDIMQEWVATLDGRTRHSHAAMDGEKIEPGKKFSNGCRYPGDPSGPSWEVYNCFVGETQIASDSGIVRSYKHEYDGELVEVKTSSGVNFTCTPNHPILTPGGWVAAARLHDGDDLLVTFSGDACTFRRYGNIEHIHSRMKALYNALHRFGLMSRDSTLCVDFHGDIPAKNVEIIAKEWVLRDNGDSGSGKRVNKFLLKDSDKTLMRKSAFVEHFWRVWKSAFCFIGGKCKALSLFRRGVSHADVHGFGAVSRRNVGVSKDAVNDLTAEAKTFCEVLDGFSGSIAADKVINVKIIPAGSATTHVYNLQTENGYYFVNSSIAQNKSKCNGIFAIAKNCRCTLIASLPDVDTSDAKRWARDPETGEAKLIEDMTFSEWEKWKGRRK